MSVFGPGTQLPLHRCINMGVLGYHYGLGVGVPTGDDGMAIVRSPFKRENHTGYVFDDTLLHDSWNMTSSPRSHCSDQQSLHSPAIAVSALPFAPTTLMPE